MIACIDATCPDALYLIGDDEEAMLPSHRPNFPSELLAQARRKTVEIPAEVHARLVSALDAPEHALTRRASHPSLAIIAAVGAIVGFSSACAFAAIQGLVTIL